MTIKSLYFHHIYLNKITFYLKKKLFLLENDLFHKFDKVLNIL